MGRGEGEKPSQLGAASRWRESSDATETGSYQKLSPQLGRNESWVHMICSATFKGLVWGKEDGSRNQCRY